MLKNMVSQGKQCTAFTPLIVDQQSNHPQWNCHRGQQGQRCLPSKRAGAVIGAKQMDSPNVYLKYPLGLSFRAHGGTVGF